MNKKIISLHSNEFYKRKSLDIESEAKKKAEIKKYKEAAELFEEAFKFDPSEIDYVYFAAVYFYMDKKYIDSRRCFKRTLEYSPNEIEYLYAFGELLYELKEYDNSKKQFEKILELEGYHIKSLIYIGKCLCKQGKVKEGIEKFESILMFDGKNPEVLFEMGCAYLSEFNYGIAEKYLKKSLEEKKDEYIIYHFLMKLYLRIGEHDKAIEIMEESKIRCCEEIDIANKNIYTIKMIKKI